MKRHFEWLTQPDQTLKDRSRFWTWYMRGLHGDMDTRYEGDRSSLSRASSQVPGGRHIYTSTEPSGFNFKPLASSTYGYHPKGVSLTRRPDAGKAAQAAVAGDALNAALDNNRPNWSTPMKNLDDVMLMREPRSASAAPSRRSLVPIDPALDDLLKRNRSPMWPRRALANRLWNPDLFWADDEPLKPRSWINDPWWHQFPELRPLDLAVAPYNRTPEALRNSYLSPIKRTYVWGIHPLRPYGYHSFESRF